MTMGYAQLDTSFIGMDIRKPRHGARCHLPLGRNFPRVFQKLRRGPNYVDDTRLNLDPSCCPGDGGEGLF